MFERNLLKALVLIGLALPLAGCTTSGGLDSITVTPQTDALVVGGAPLQLTATGTFGNAKSPSTQIITNQVTWSSAIPGVASVSSSGLVTAVGAGTVSITATAQGFAGPVSGSVNVTVTSSGGGTVGGDIVSISIIPTTQSVTSPGQTSQFIAIGTTSSGSTENITSQVAWSSSSANVASICIIGAAAPCTAATTGLATALNQGTSTITAIATNPDKSVATGTATFTVTSGGAASQAVTSLSIVPGSQTLAESGESGRYIALATFGSSGLIQDVTNSPQLQWISSIPTIASITTYPASPAGVAGGVSPGSTTITAEYTNPATASSPANTVYASVPITITNTPAPEPLLSLTIIPSAITVGDLQDTGQFLAVGTFSVAPYVRDLTDSVVWISTFPNVFPVDTNTGGNTQASAGIVTAYGSGSGTIIAEATDPTTKSIQTATATFSCPLVLVGPDPTCYPGSQAPALLSTVTVYNEGLNTTNWVVTAPSATGTANVIHCGPGWTGAGGSVCVATYPIGVPVVLTAPAGAGAFGGWSSDCTPNPNPPTANGPNTCTIVPNSPPYSATNPAPTNITVGAIFN